MTSKKQSDDGKGRKRPLERAEPLNDAHLMESKRQCPAMSKRTGERCKRFCALGQRTCRWHGSATRKAKTAAAVRIRQASGYAADMLAEFMADPGVPLELRTKIAQDLLNRAGISEKHILELQPKAMSPFERAVLSSYVDEDGKPAFVDDGEGGMKAVTPGGGLSADVVVLDDDDPNIWDAEVIEDDDTTPLVPREEQNRHDRAVFREVERNRRAVSPGDARSRTERLNAEREALDLIDRPRRSTGRSDDDGGDVLPAGARGRASAPGAGDRAPPER